MRSSFSDFRAQLDCTAPAAHLPEVASLSGGGVADGMNNLSLEDQGAVLPGTPISNSRASSPKVYFPVVIREVDDVEDVCLAIIGQGLSLCLRESCPTVAHRDARRFSFPEGPAILIRKAKDVAFCEPTLPFRRMEDELLFSWKSTPRTLSQWSETFSAY